MKQFDQLAILLNKIMVTSIDAAYEKPAAKYRKIMDYTGTISPVDPTSGVLRAADFTGGEDVYVYTVPVVKQIGYQVFKPDFESADSFLEAVRDHWLSAELFSDETLKENIVWLAGYTREE